MRFDASERGKLDFVLRPEIPYLGEWCIQPEDGCSRTGKIEASGNTLTLSGVLGYYGIRYEGAWRVLLDGGSVRAEGETLIVSGADRAVLFFAAATNYRLESRVFLESDPKKKLSPYPHPHDAVMARMEKACRAGYDALLAEHLSDYRALFSRVRLSLGESVPAVPTDRMIEDYKNGKESRYAELLLYAYGRYLLIACSRRGGLPANLQGVWAAGRSTPWSGGYWHNVNVQMNYWHACATGLSELFLAYSDYARAYMPLARAIADGYVRTNYPDRDGGAVHAGSKHRDRAFRPRDGRVYLASFLGLLRLHARRGVFKRGCVPHFARDVALFHQGACGKGRALPCRAVGFSRERAKRRAVSHGGLCVRSADGVREF